MAKKKSPSTLHIRNRRASFKYEILEKLQCGIILTGTEVKSLRQGQAIMEESYARVASNQILLRGLTIPQYAFGNVNNHVPDRERKLLLHRTEISRLAAKVAIKGHTLIPLDLHFNERGLVKITLAVARGKNVADKRRTIRDREDKKALAQAMKKRYPG